jgi:hypothetical protein
MSLTAEQEAFLASIEAKGSRPDKASILGTPLLLTDDGGRIYETPEGLVFTSPGYSTSDQKVIREIIEQQKKEGGKPQGRWRSRVSDRIFWARHQLHREALPQYKAFHLSVNM